MGMEAWITVNGTTTDFYRCDNFVHDVVNSEDELEISCCYRGGFGDMKCIIYTRKDPDGDQPEEFTYETIEPNKIDDDEYFRGSCVIDLTSKYGNDTQVELFVCLGRRNTPICTNPISAFKLDLNKTQY